MIFAKGVIQSVQKIVVAQLGIEPILLSSYCNDYMGYIATHKEYQQQDYESRYALYG